VSAASPARTAPGRRRAGLCRAVAFVLAAGGACASQPVVPAGPAPLCRIDTLVATDKPLRERLYPTQYWFVLLVSGYQTSGEIARPARDCRGLPTTLMHDGCAPEPPPPASPAALTPADLHIAMLGDSRRLVWVETNHLPDGRAEGPVAIVEIDDRGLSVRALGVLRAFHDNVTLRLASLGGGTVLVAESERCETLRTRGEDGRAPRACDRAIRVVPLLDGRFVDRPIIDERGQCLEPAFFPVRASGAAPDGARYQLEGAVSFAADAITVREQLALSEDRERNDAAASSYVTRVEAERRITWRGGSLVASQASLLSRWIARHASGRGGAP
jgi:hypothetical protein